MYIMFFDPFQHSENVQCAFPTVKETVPRSKLGYATNNVFPEFPPLMSDGRSIIATFQSETDTNAITMKSNGIKSNWQYRNYLVDNGASIMRENFKEACNDVGYFERFSPATTDGKEKIKSQQQRICELKVELTNLHALSQTPTNSLKSNHEEIKIRNEEIKLLEIEV